MTNFQKVKTFMQTFGQEVKLKPSFSTEKINDLRYNLVKEELEELTTVNVKAIKTVSESLTLKGYPRSNFSWPGDVYIEDINAESDLDLVKTIIKTVAKHGEL